MATKTRRELVEEALDILVPESGQAHAPEDVATVDGFVDSVIDDLALRRVYQVQDDEHIEPAPFVYLAQLLAYAAKNKFGGVNLDVMEAERRLRVQAAPGPTYSTLTAEYF